MSADTNLAGATAIDVSTIRAAVERGEIGGISVDTSVFDELKWGFEHGLLKRLRQFKGSPVRLVLSDVVMREVQEHAAKDASDSKAALERAIKGIGSAWQVARDARSAALQNLLGTCSHQDVSRQRVEKFIGDTGAIVLDASAHVPVGEVLERYFNAIPPFSTSEAKKHEFPDAFALLTLASWARQQNTKVVVVAKDGDWKAFCASSDRLIAVDQLAHALACFQREATTYQGRELAEMLRQGDKLGVRAAIQEALVSQCDEINFSVDADSQFSCEVDDVTAILTLGEIGGLDADEVFDVVEATNSHVIAQLSFTANASLEVSISFMKWDSIDRDYVPMGSGTAAPEEEIVIEALVTFALNARGEPEAVEDVELLSDTHHVELTDLEPDWMSDPDAWD